MVKSWQFLGDVARWLPSYGSTAAGRRGGRLVQLAIAATGAWVALLHPTPSGLAAGAAIASCAAWLPLPRHRRRMLESRLRARALPRATTAIAVGRLVWDGAKLTVWQGERVWRSARPAGAEHTFAVGAHEGQSYLGFVHRHRGAPKSLWIVRASAGSAVLPPIPPADAAGIDAAVRVSEELWDALHDALVCPSRTSE